jgi:hypothetical protein
MNLYAMFEQINLDSTIDEQVPLTSEHRGYYEEQIANLIDGGFDISSNEITDFLSKLI